MTIKPRTAAEINAINAAFWGAKSEWLQKWAKGHPEDIEDAVRRLKDDLARGNQIARVAGIEYDLQPKIDRYREKQSKIAKGKKKGPRSPIVKFIVEYMKRNPGVTAKDVEDALVAEAESGDSGRIALKGNKFVAEDANWQERFHLERKNVERIFNRYYTEK